MSCIIAKTEAAANVTREPISTKMFSLQARTCPNKRINRHEA
jgi:hypothetical protein